LSTVPTIFISGFLSKVFYLQISSIALLLYQKNM